MRDPATGERIELPVLYRDEHVVAVNKPAGLLVHRTQIAPGERLAALQIVRDQLGQSVYPVHRLDRPTSGILLFGLSAEVGRMLSEAFSRGEIRKTYVAVVRGWLDEAGTIDSALGDLREYTSSGRPGPAKPARSDYLRLADIEVPHPVGRYETARYSLAQVHPKTGKRHQVRRHMRRIGHPIIGDRRHGDRDHNRYFESRFGHRHLLLCAIELELIHPLFGDAVRITATVDDGFRRVFDAFDWTGVVPDSWLAT